MGLGAASPAREFSLTDQHGNTVTATSFRGQWLIVFFGFTQCPDVCPLTLTQLAAALHDLGSDANEYRTVFITIDPEHDTPEVLGAYLRSFGPDFIGLTGSEAQITAAAASFGAYRGRDANAGGAPAALVHSSTLYVVGPDGRLSRQLSAELSAPQLAASLRRARHPNSQTE
jgi:protein SCO1/2